MGLSLHDFQEAATREWSEVASRVSVPVRSALEKVLASEDGGVLTREDCLQVAHAENHDLLGMMLAADLLRRRAVGDVVTYVVNRNINFTNVCFIGCKFFAFSRGPRESDAYFLSFDHIAQRTLEARERGATEVCVQGGLPRELPPLYYRD